MSITRLLVGLVGCLLLSLVGQALGCMALDGVVMLAVLGSLVFGSGGWTWGLLVAVILVVRLGLTWRGRVNDEMPRSWLTIVAIWGPPTLAALIYGAGEHTSAWAAFIGATAFAAADEAVSGKKGSVAFSLLVGTLTGAAMLVLHDVAAVRRGLPTGWIDLWLIPLGVIGALIGLVVQVWARPWLHPDLARLLGSIVAAGATALIGQAGWQLLGPILY
jgi:uncharacterized membrane protein